jgi:cholinesterase
MFDQGGGFALGNTASPAYNGARLAEDQDVVVVSMNYRLNILGFPGAPGLPDQNLGLLDQRLAIEWVRDNIGVFGGAL